MLCHVDASTGSISTAESFEPKVNAEVVFGTDSLRLDPDGKRVRANMEEVAKLADLEFCCRF